MAEVDVTKEIRRAVDTGKVEFGVRESEKNILNGKAQLVIVSSNTPKLTIERISNLSEAAGTAVYSFSGTGLELGAVCGKPFVVSVMVVTEPGKSKVFDIVESKKITVKSKDENKQR